MPATRISPVFFLRRQLRRFTWIALTAMLALALVPTLSHALSAARGQSDLAEICTPQGARLVPVSGDGTQPAPGALLGHFDHCPLCSLQGASLGLPPTADHDLAPPDLSHAVPALFLAAPRPLFAWGAAQARAPPTLS
jgi:hypothetical protein